MVDAFCRRTWVISSRPLRFAPSLSYKKGTGDRQLDPLCVREPDICIYIYIYGIPTIEAKDSQSHQSHTHFRAKTTQSLSAIPCSSPPYPLRTPLPTPHPYPTNLTAFHLLPSADSSPKKIPRLLTPLHIRLICPDRSNALAAARAAGCTCHSSLLFCPHNMGRSAHGAASGAGERSCVLGLGRWRC